MPRRKKSGKTIVIGSMVVNVDDDVDVGEGNSYDVVSSAKRKQMPWLPKSRGEGCVERTQLFIWDTFEDSEGSKISSYINFWIMLLIILSAIIAVVETIPSIHIPANSSTPDRENPWYICEFFFVMNFSVEFVSRAITCPDMCAFCKTPMNYIDVVAILPFYIEVIMSVAAGGGSTPNFGFLRILRLGRAFRLVKLSRYSQGIRLVTNAMAKSLDALQLFSLLLILVLVVCSSGMYYAENGTWYEEEPSEWTEQFGIGSADNGSIPFIGWRYYRTDTQIGGTGKIEVSPSPYQSIPQSMWWCVVTLTTVGYGDMYPYTAAGKTICILTMLLGLIMLALPLSIIGTNFIEERNLMVAENKNREKKKLEEGVEPEPVPVYSMRKDLRELLVKADGLKNSTDSMNSMLVDCSRLLRTMRRAVVSNTGTPFSPRTAAGTAAVRSAIENRREGADVGAQAPSGSGAGSAGSGSGAAGSTEGVVIEMDGTQSAPEGPADEAALLGLERTMYVVPFETMEELKGRCRDILRLCIAEMKVWDPQSDIPEMPAEIVALLAAVTDDEKVAASALEEDHSATATAGGQGQPQPIKEGSGRDAGAGIGSKTT